MLLLFFVFFVLCLFFLWPKMGKKWDKKAIIDKQLIVVYSINIWTCYIVHTHSNKLSVFFLRQSVTSRGIYMTKLMRGKSMSKLIVESKLRTSKDGDEVLLDLEINSSCTETQSYWICWWSPLTHSSAPVISASPRRSCKQHTMRTSVNEDTFCGISIKRGSY